MMELLFSLRQSYMWEQHGSELWKDAQRWGQPGKTAADVNGAADACPAGEAVRPDEGGKRLLVRRGV